MDLCFLDSEASLSEFIAKFEDGTWPKSQWRHGHHLAVAACYLEDEAFPMDRMRERIKFYNVCQGGQNTEDAGYHETLTHFWLLTVKAYMTTLPDDRGRLEKVRLVVERFAPERDLFTKYYDFDVVASREARALWMEPARAVEAGGF